MTLRKDGALRESGFGWPAEPPFPDGTKAAGVLLYIRKDTAAALQAIRPEEDLQDRNSPVFGLSLCQNAVECRRR